MKKILIAILFLISVASVNAQRGAKFFTPHLVPAAYLINSSGDVTDTLATRAYARSFGGGGGGSDQTGTYTQNATNNTYSLSGGGNSQTWLTATTSLAGLFDTASKKKVDSLRNQLPGNVTIVRTNGFTGDSLNVNSNHYSPTAASVANVASVSANSCAYSRSGNVVTIGGSGSVTATSTTTYTRFSLTLPITCQGSSAGVGGGTLTVDGTTFMLPGVVSANNLTTMILSYISNGTSALPYSFTYTYEIR